MRTKPLPGYEASGGFMARVCQGHCNRLSLDDIAMGEIELHELFNIEPIESLPSSFVASRYCSAMGCRNKPRFQARINYFTRIDDYHVNTQNTLSDLDD